jgi:SSS family solute:Na+ symporter
LTYLVFYYTNAWFLLSLTILIWNVVPAWRWSQQGWTKWFIIETYWIGMGTGLITTIWFAWGTVRDLRRLFGTLATYERDASDDGRVRAAVSPAVAVPPEPPPVVAATAQTASQSIAID